MKKLALLAFLITGVMNAQQYGQKWNQRDKSYYGFVSTGFDIRNLTIGSKATDNKPALDFNLKVGARANALEVSLFYENFSQIDFQAYGSNVSGVFQLHKNFDVALGLELGSINRAVNSNYIMAGFNSELRYDLGKLILSLQLNNRYRGDLKKYGDDFPIVNSVFLNVYYKLN